jgi:hypothetical protein
MKKMKALGICWLLIAPVLYAQQYNSVPLDHGAYRVIEQGVLRGILRPPPSAKPWPEFVVREKLTEMVNAEEGALSEAERRIASGLLAGFERKEGFDFNRGTYYREYGKGDSGYALEAGVSWDSTVSINPAPSPAWGTVNIGTFSLAGNLGRFFSYNLNVRGGFFHIDRQELGLGGASGKPGLPVYTLPSYFPYTFTKVWDGAVFKPSSLGGYDGWPDSLSFGYEIISEINTALVDRRLQFRFGRMRRDWGAGMGASLYMNARARPLIALEGTAHPADWMAFSFLTGVPEYLKINNQKQDAAAYQNAFSLALLEFNIGPYAHFGFGSAAVWPKRFELGYLFPLNSNFLYQNNVGDFDNLALFADLEGRWPGIGKAWVSLFLDEANLAHQPFFNLDRQMYAYQGGLKVSIPWLPFADVSLRYTKIEPYCYTHPATEVPWNTNKANTAYLNNGESLGYYLPPNTDELLIRPEMMFLLGDSTGTFLEISAYLQYQLIRHGAEYGPGRVDGSSPWDELVYDDFTTKYFLRDGVYRWDHVIKLGGSCRITQPITVFAELGVVISRFSRGDGPGAPYYYLPAADPDYPSGESFIFSLGFRLFK